MEIDLKSKVAKLDGMINRKFKLVKSEAGQRQRDSQSRRNDGNVFNIFPKDFNNFGIGKGKKIFKHNSEQGSLATREKGAYVNLWK